MKQQTTIIIIITVAVLLIIGLMIKNSRDRKKLITPGEGTDPVNEVHREEQNQAEKS